MTDVKTSNLVSRLREFDWYGPPREGADALLNEAADWIDRASALLPLVSREGGTELAKEVSALLSQQPPQPKPGETSKQQFIKYVDAALAQIKHLMAAPANYAAACGVGEEVLQGVRDFLRRDQTSAKEAEIKRLRTQLLDCERLLAAHDPKRECGYWLRTSLPNETSPSESTCLYGFQADPVDVMQSGAVVYGSLTARDPDDVTRELWTITTYWRRARCHHAQSPVSVCGRHLKCPDCGAVVTP